MAAVRSADRRAWEVELDSQGSCKALVHACSWPEEGGGVVGDLHVVPAGNPLLWNIGHSRIVSVEC
eukprot:4681533-Amphidinium_carterae.1